jgi:hypothetical protein
MQAAQNSLFAFNDRYKARFWSKIKKDGPVPDQSNPHYAGLGPCWEWTRSVNSAGYGAVWYNGKLLGAHRISFLMKHGEIPKESPCILHRCDNPKCCNPDHLFSGTRADNARDMVKKKRSSTGDRNGSRTMPERRARGDRHKSVTKPESVPRGKSHFAAINPKRMARGEKSGLAKLTNEKVREIRTIYALGNTSLRKLGGEFGVSGPTIRDIVVKKIWRHVV